MKRVFSVFVMLTVVAALMCGGVSAEEAKPTATSADLNHEELVMLPGKTQELKLQVLPAAADVSGAVWTSDNENVVLVSGSTVTSVAQGTATVTAALPNGLTDSCKVTVVSGEKVLNNSTFEETDQTAWVLGGAAVIEHRGGYAESACVKVDYQSLVSQTMQSLKSNTAYTAIMRVKATDDAKTTVYFRTDEKVFAEQEITLGKSWGLRTVEFTTGSVNGKEQIVFENANTEGAVFYVDNVVVAEKASDADLVVEALDWTGGDGQVKPGTKLTFTATVKNKGTADVAEPFKVEFRFGTDVVATAACDGVKAGESVTVTAKPWRAIKGDRMLSAIVNPDLTVSESNYSTNNTRQINLRVANERVEPAYNADVVTEAGMLDLTFNDDFNDLSSVDTLASGAAGYKWYVTRQWKQTDMTREDYFVKDGVFTLEHLDSKYAIGASTVDSETAAGYTFNKGYMEIKLRIPEPIKNEGVRSYPAIWSLPPGKWCEIEGENTHWVEMDWLEYYGKGRYTITMHEQEYLEDGSLNQYTSNDNTRHGLDDKEWHVMGFLWEDDHLRCYLDGELLREQTWSADTYPQPMHQNVDGEVRIEGVFDIFDTQESLLYLAGTRGMPLELDYVRIWQLGGGTDNTQSTGLPAGVLWGGIAAVVIVVALVLLLPRKGKVTEIQE